MGGASGRNPSWAPDCAGAVRENSAYGRLSRIFLQKRKADPVNRGPIWKRCKLGPHMRRSAARNLRIWACFSAFRIAEAAETAQMRPQLASLLSRGGDRRRVGRGVGVLWRLLCDLMREPIPALGPMPGAHRVRQTGPARGFRGPSPRTLPRCRAVLAGCARPPCGRCWICGSSPFHPTRMRLLREAMEAQKRSVSSVGLSAANLVH